jgi:retron-type reverse transcriptase
VYGAWQAFARGKRTSPAIVAFRSALEDNLLRLAGELQDRTYRHGAYQSFVVRDPKRRDIAVAAVRDRVVHRLLYDHIVPLWDRSFCYDAWSCRKHKGLQAAVQRAQAHMHAQRRGWLWRSDITKFFDTVDHRVLRFLLRTKAPGERTLWLLDSVVASYEAAGPGRGMPIGNLTSQIFANIYLNEFDQFALHSLRPRAYVRYGDDFVLWCENELMAREARAAGEGFLKDYLRLAINAKHDRVQPASTVLPYLGVDLWPEGRRLQPRVGSRIGQRLDTRNLASYRALLRSHQPARRLRSFAWKSIDIIDKQC